MLLDDGHHVTLLAETLSESANWSAVERISFRAMPLTNPPCRRPLQHAAGLSEDGLAGMAHLVGSIALRPPHATKLEDFQAVIQTNLISAFLALKTAGKAMLKSGTGEWCLPQASPVVTGSPTTRRLRPPRVASKPWCVQQLPPMQDVAFVSTPSHPASPKPVSVRPFFARGHPRGLRWHDSAQTHQRTR